jgi:O-antigen ligase
MLAMLSASDAARITLDNAWLEIVTDSGVVGLVIFGFVVLLVAYTLFSNARKPTGEYKHLAAECLAILVLLAFRSFFVSSITLHSEFAFLAIVGCAEYIRQASLPHKL